MTKRMREIKADILAKAAEAKGYTEGETKDITKAAQLLDEIDTLQKEYDTLARLEEAEKGKLPDNLPDPAEASKASGFKAIAKMLKKQPLDEKEKALVTGGDSGENFLVPEDVKAEINELRKSYISAKELATVITTESMAGSVTYEAGTPAGLVEFEDGEEIAAETGISFVVKKFAIKLKGKLIAISRILAGAEKAGLMSYLDRWFVRNAIVSENGDIFAALKAGYNDGAPKAVPGWEALKKSITMDLDPSCLIGGVIATNQSGFACLDAEKDENGRPILQPNPANPTEKLFQGLPVKVYPDAQLPNIDGTHFPVFYGNTAAGVTFVEHLGLEFSLSEHALFGKNQNCLRVIEGYDVMSTDTTAYIYGSFSATV